MYPRPAAEGATNLACNKSHFRKAEHFACDVHFACSRTFCM